jgi:hypothetical protein
VGYEVRLKGGEVETVEQADSYQQEGPLTTFFQTRPGRTVIDCWARRVASYRTADIVRIRCDRHRAVDIVRAGATPQTLPSGLSSER